MLWRPDPTSLASAAGLDGECLWRRSSLGARAHAWYVGLLPQGCEVTFEVGEASVIAYADGRVAGHAVLDEDGSLGITVAPEFVDRGIEDELVVQATRVGRVAGS